MLFSGFLFFSLSFFVVVVDVVVVYVVVYVGVDPDIVVDAGADAHVDVDVVVVGWLLQRMKGIDHPSAPASKVAVKSREAG